MIAIDTLTTFVVVSILLGLAPGPDNIFVLTQSALFGRKAGLLVTIGLCTGLIAHTIAVALGVATLLQASAIAFTALKILGALYLLYLAWLAFRSRSSKLQYDKSKSPSISQLYRRGIIMNITNPKVSIFFLAFLPQFAKPENGPIAQQIFILGAIFIVVTMAVFGSIALLAGALGNWLNRTPKSQIYLNRIAGTVFTALAIKLISSDIKL